MSRFFVYGLLAAVASCGAVERARADEINVSLGAVSQHFPRAAYQQTNKGIGIEYRSGDWGVRADTYDNSNHHTTHALLGEWLPLHTTVGPLKVDAGLLAGVADGYKRNHGNFAPVALPIVSIQYGRVGVNLVAAPAAEKGGAAMVAAQINLTVARW